MKVLSWNIWVDGNFDLVKDVLNSVNADVVGLQEVKDDDPTHDVIGYLTELGYKHIFSQTEQVWDGVIYRHGPAIFSRYPIVYSGTFYLDEKKTHAVAQADIMVDGTIFHIYSTHLVHTHQDPSRKQEDQVTRLINCLAMEHVVVMGDFNATPTSSSIQKIKEILVDSGSDSDFTWSVYPAGCNICNPQALDTRLDYIFISNDLKAESFEVIQSKASDHLPISADITMR